MTTLKNKRTVYQPPEITIPPLPSCLANQPARKTVSEQLAEAQNEIDRLKKENRKLKVELILKDPPKKPAASATPAAAPMNRQQAEAELTRLQQSDLKAAREFWQKHRKLLS